MSSTPGRPEGSEKDFQRSVIRLATLCGWLTYHTHDSRGSSPGFPDLVLVRDRVIFAELKTTKGRLGQHQLDWLARLREAGAETYLWRPAHWTQIQRVLSRRRDA